MEYKKALSILLKMLKNPKFSAEEKEAITTAISTLDAGSLMNTRFKGIMKIRKNKNKKSLEL